MSVSCCTVRTIGIYLGSRKDIFDRLRNFRADAISFYQCNAVIALCSTH